MAATRYRAEASVHIDASPREIWGALIEPDRVEQYMFGTRLSTDWGVGSPITWSGEWQGKSYQDKGEILEFRPETRISYSHYSPLSGAPDVPENYHTVTIELTPNENGTTVTLAQDNNGTEETRDHSQANWQSMLDGLKDHVEGERGSWA
ncbi:MAG TPA: SRPBCC domain-containing protein [Acidimicrobiia bacterium]